MSTGGRAVARSGRAVLGVAACLLLAACESGSSSDLEQRVDELEQENEALRAQLESLSTAADVTAEPGSTVVAETAQPVRPDETTTTPTSSAVVVTSVAPPPGSRQNPHPLGATVPAGDWTYTVVGFETNVDEFVTQLSPNNEPAGEGKVYARLRVRAVYGGAGGGDPRRLTINLLSPSGATIGAADPCCRPQRDALSDQAETFTGGVVEGWIYYPVSVDDLFSGGQFIAFDPNADARGVPGGTVFFAAT